MKKKLRLPVKGTGSRDGLELGCHAWVDLGLRKGRGRFLNFSYVPNVRKKFIFLEVNAKPTLFDYVR